MNLALTWRYIAAVDDDRTSTDPSLADPPLVGQDTCPAVYCNGNTFPQVYDTLGRYVFLGLTADF